MRTMSQAEPGGNMSRAEYVLYLDRVPLTDLGRIDVTLQSHQRIQDGVVCRSKPTV